MKIDFYNRDGNGVWIGKVGEEGWWQLRMDQPSLFNYTRLIFEEEDNQGIYAVDPPGGPFISVGSEVEGLVVTEIKNTSLGIFLRLKKNTKTPT
jgi:hypothetical protein